LSFELLTPSHSFKTRKDPSFSRDTLEDSFLSPRSQEKLDKTSSPEEEALQGLNEAVEEQDTEGTKTVANQANEAIEEDT
jgi:hypothetical protein